MAEANDVYGSIYQNLIDAGCDTKTTEPCMALEGREKCTLPLLFGGCVQSCIGTERAADYTRGRSCFFI